MKKNNKHDQIISQEGTGEEGFNPTVNRSTGSSILPVDMTNGKDEMNIIDLGLIR